MGEGTGKDYRPYITTSEFNSQGTTSVIRDWKTDRGVHCLSQGEMLWYYILRWDDENIDIREQYPLDYGETVRIAEKMGFTPPKDRMTTDLLVTRSDGSYIAYSVKPDRDLGERQLQLLCVEKQYWIEHGVPYKLNLGFLKDVRRLNVAFSRARELLVVVGDHQCAQRRLDINGQENPFVGIIKFIRDNSDDCMLKEV